MISFGKNIQSAVDPLVKVDLDKIYHALHQPKSETMTLLRQLRIIYGIDKKRYSVLKRQLPYMVCGIFNPPFRRSENFGYIEYYILDIDRISEKQLSLSDLRHRIETDPRVVLSFVSPSEDGLKVMFRMRERCYDKGKFSLFYRLFAQQFARKYDVEQVIDRQTCDVTRACFVSADPDVYYNPKAETVDILHYLPEDDPTELFDLKRRSEKETAERPDDGTSEKADAAEKKTDVDADVVKRIKAILNPAAANKPSKPVYVPEQLNDIMENLSAYITRTGIEITEVLNISYGKKIRMRLRARQAEVNLFYGKKGFSVVKSPRTGTDEELNDLMVSLVQTFLMQ